MANTEARKLVRSDVQMTAEIQVENLPGRHLVKIRNLSSSGLMGEGQVAVTRGSKVTLELRGEQPIEGMVAWVQEDRFGVGFNDRVDDDWIERRQLLS